MLESAHLEKESRDLDEFYHSVRLKAQGITNPAAKQDLIRQGYLEDVFPYPPALRLSRRHGAESPEEPPSSPPSLSHYSQSQIVNERH